VFLRACRKYLKNGEILTASGHKTFFLGREKNPPPLKGLQKPCIYTTSMSKKKKQFLIPAKYGNCL
jgi:hypothetical protein